MIQFFWLFDFVGLLLARLLVAIGLFLTSIRIYFEMKKTVISMKNFLLKIEGLIYFLSSFLIFIGFLSSFVSAFWILFLSIKILKERIKDKIPFSENLSKIYLIAFFITILFVGPGKLSIDRIFGIRF